MNLAPDPMGPDEARAMLDQLPELYLSVLKNTHIEQTTGEEVRCSFELPVVGKRTTTAPTALQAIRAALLELTDFLTTTPPNEWPEELRGSVLSQPAALPDIRYREDDKVERFQAKARQFTIGVTMPVSLKVSLQNIADQHQVSFAEVARQLAGDGFEDFDERTYSEGSEELFSMLSAEVRRWLPSDTEQVMVRVEPHLAVRLRSTAKEHRRSASEFGAMCLAHGLVLQTQFSEVEEKVAAYRGPAIRELARQIGLGAYPALLSGVLAGSIRAPSKLLGRLSNLLGAPERALTGFFTRCFTSRLVPAFKAENGKPQVSALATSWEEAVRSLNLSQDKTTELLQLDEQSP